MVHLIRAIDLSESASTKSLKSAIQRLLIFFIAFGRCPERVSSAVVGQLLLEADIWGVGLIESGLNRESTLPLHYAFPS